MTTENKWAVGDAIEAESDTYFGGATFGGVIEDIEQNTPWKYKVRPMGVNQIEHPYVFVNDEEIVSEPLVPMQPASTNTVTLEYTPEAIAEFAEHREVLEHIVKINARGDGMSGKTSRAIQALLDLLPLGL